MPPHTDVELQDVSPVVAVRVCHEDGCETRLSIYNEYEYCSLHQPMIIPRMRGKVL